MGKGRLEAFSDGVIAIIITIMVLEMKVPHGDSLEALLPLVPVFLSYVLSFVYVGIYWNNHHHMLHASVKVSGSVFGRTFTCCSGFRSFHSQRVGWARTTSLPCRRALRGGTADGSRCLLGATANNHCGRRPSVGAQVRGRR